MDGDLVGKKLAHFRIVAKVGQGGMGVVYTAEDEKLGRTVALKVLREDYVGDEVRRARFLREARSAAAVTHPNIATVHEVGEVDGVVYIAMELVDGQSLRQILATRTLSIRDALRIAKDVARGVARAHAKGIVHRDLKPDNVMVGGDGHAKVLDFGVAKSERASEGASRADEPLNVTETGQMLGTPAYMAPEQAMGEKVDARADVFSFGVMLYEMVAGTRPFESSSAVAMLVAAARDAPAAPSKRNPFVTAELERVIARCLEKKPADRYASLRELVVELETVESAQQNSASLPTLDAQTTAVSGGTATRKTKRRPVVVVVAVLVVLFAAAVYRFTPRSPPFEASTAPSAPSAAGVPSAVPTTLSDLPPPRSTSTAALDAYKTALQAFRDGNFEEFDLGMREAVKLEGAWSGTPDAATARFLKIERLAGTIREDELRAARARFLEEWGRQASRTRFFRGVEWILGYGAQVESKADADEAIRELPSFAPIPVGQRTAMNDDALGRARLFSGDAAGAVAPLTRAARMCVAMDDPFRHVRAYLLLGRAFEGADPSGACDAYKVVLARWGDAKPRSVTADEARRRSRALACAR